MRDAFIKELTQLARTDDRVFLVVGDLGFSVVEDFQAEFPDRFLNPGVDEQSTVGIAAGLAASGYSVFVYSIANFPTLRPLEQIRNDVCYHDRDVTIVSVGGGFAYGYLGYTHHAVEDIAVMRAMPGMTVLSPADPVETAVAARSILDIGGPHYLRLGKNGETRLHETEPTRDALGRGLVMRDGDDVVILATGSILQSALTAADALATDGVSARVVSAPVVKPFEIDVASLAEGTAGVVTVEEHTLHGGLASAVLESLAVRGELVPVHPLYAREETIGRIVGSQQWARDQNRLGVADIVSSAQALVATRRISR